MPFNLTKKQDTTPKPVTVTTKVEAESDTTHKVTYNTVVGREPFNAMRLGMCVNNVCDNYTHRGKSILNSSEFESDVIKLYHKVEQIEINLKAERLKKKE